MVQQISKKRKFPESIDVLYKLDVDPTQGNQNIRGTCILPAGTGKELKVCVFADPDFHQQCRELGADHIGDENTLKDISEGKVNFDKIISTPEHLPSLKAHARILGPRGLMPNVKSGTLVKNDTLLEAIKSSKQGMIEYRINDA